jgi:hypothetical protein
VLREPVRGLLEPAPRESDDLEETMGRYYFALRLLLVYELMLTGETSLWMLNSFVDRLLPCLTFA